MTQRVVDSSALLAMLLGEPGSEQVKSMLGTAMMSTVNLAEVVSYYAKLGTQREDVETMLRQLPLKFIPVDETLSLEAGMLRWATMASGLSLGDRFCLALARREAAPAVTADRRWLDVSAKIGVTIELIR